MKAENDTEDRMKNKLVITEKDDVIYYGFFSGGEPLELYCESKQQQSLLGNIYAARVEKIAEGIGGAFLEISDGEKCYFSLSQAQNLVRLSCGHEHQLRGGDIVLIQIAKDAVKTKLPVGDANISLTGKYFVFTLADKRAGISRKLQDTQERKRLSDIAAPFQNEKYGIVIRTNASGVDETILTAELKMLSARYQELMRRAKIAPGKNLLYRNPPHYISYGQDLPKKQLDSIVTDNPGIYTELLDYLAEKGDEEGKQKVSLYTDAYPLTKLYRFGHYYEKALDKHVWLKSGGSLVIEQTETLVAIDVNTGCVTKGKKQAENIFFQMNCEAAREIAKQIRLRNLSGIILVDFINMKKKEQREELMLLLQKECEKDRVRTRVIDMTALNLVEMIRTKVRRPLYEQWTLSHGKDSSVCF